MSHILITTIPRPKIDIICAVRPIKGLVGKTLFTITCNNFKNQNIFEFYQKNKNDETAMGKQLKYTV